MIYLWALCLANEFMSLSLGEEDLVITKCCHCQHISCWGEAGKEIPAQLPWCWSLLPPVFGAVRGKTIVQLQPSSAQGLLSGLRAFGMRRGHRVQWKTSHLCPFSHQELLILLLHKSSFIGSTWAWSVWNTLPYPSAKGWRRVRFWPKHSEKKAGLWARRWFCISGMGTVLTHMATKSPDGFKLCWRQFAFHPHPFQSHFTSCQGSFSALV